MKTTKSKYRDMAEKLIIQYQSRHDLDMKIININVMETEIKQEYDRICNSYTDTEIYGTVHTQFVRKNLISYIMRRKLKQLLPDYVEIRLDSSKASSTIWKVRQNVYAFLVKKRYVRYN